MSLYLCIFNDDEEEIEGVEVGPYANFNEVRNFIVNALENGNPGSRFPTFILHSDSEGEWSYQDCISLRFELIEIIEAMKGISPQPFSSEWQKKISASTGNSPNNSFESFIDVDGEFLLQRIFDLTEIAIDEKLPILFQ